MPVGYGQLGCSGFIISDGNGCFVSRATKRFLDYGEEAFRHVEDILRPMLVENEVASSPIISEEVEVEEKKEEAIIVDGQVKLPPSVGVDAMDDEHQECTNAFNIVLRAPTPSNMKQLYQILQSHFQHEEKLLQQYSSGGGNTSANAANDCKSSDECESCNKGGPSTFSSITSHTLDHERILGMAEAEVKRAGGSCSSSSGE